MEAQGLIERTRDQADQRVQLIALAEHGRRVADQLGRAYYNHLCRKLDDVPVEDVRAATRILNRMAANSTENPTPVTIDRPKGPRLRPPVGGPGSRLPRPGLIPSLAITSTAKPTSTETSFTSG